MTTTHFNEPDRIKKKRMCRFVLYPFFSIDWKLIWMILSTFWDHRLTNSPMLPPQTSDQSEGTFFWKIYYCCPYNRAQFRCEGSPCSALKDSSSPISISSAKPVPGRFSLRIFARTPLILLKTVIHTRSGNDVAITAKVLKSGGGTHSLRQRKFSKVGGAPPTFLRG